MEVLTDVGGEFVAGGFCGAGALVKVGIGEGA